MKKYFANHAFNRNHASNLLNFLTKITNLALKFDIKPALLRVRSFIDHRNIKAMQNKARGAVVALMMASLLAAPLAEAKRAGGGKSIGMSRAPSSSQSYNQNQNTQYRNQAPATAQQQPQRSGSNVGGMVAAGVAGAALGAVAANAMADDGQKANPNEQAANWQNGEQATQEKKSGFSWFWLIILAAAAFFLFRKFSAKKQFAGAGNPYAPNNSGASTRNQTSSPFGTTPPAGNTNIFGQPVNGGQAPVQAPFGGATTSSGNQLPDGSEPATFLRFARQRFNHIQAMNNATNIEEIRKYFTPDMYQAIYSEVANNTDVAEFSNLTANVIDQSTENGQYVVSVRFTGTVSEDLNALPQPFTEIWHFVKPVGSSAEWLVAGIQQV